MENIIITFQEPWFKSLEDYKKILELEYNSNTSAHYPDKGNDIVRTCTKMKCKN